MPKPTSTSDIALYLANKANSAKPSKTYKRAIQFDPENAARLLAPSERPPIRPRTTRPSHRKLTKSHSIQSGIRPSLQKPRQRPVRPRTTRTSPITTTKPTDANLGIALRKQGQLDQAIENYRKAIQVDPEYAYAYNNLGLALDDQGQLDQAIENFQKAIQIDPEDASAYYRLGIALSDQGTTRPSHRKLPKSHSFRPGKCSCLQQPRTHHPRPYPNKAKLEFLHMKAIEEQLAHYRRSRDGKKPIQWKRTRPGTVCLPPTT